MFLVCRGARVWVRATAGARGAGARRAVAAARTGAQRARRASGASGVGRAKARADRGGGGNEVWLRVGDTTETTVTHTPAPATRAPATSAARRTRWRSGAVSVTR